jgi:hypothetical protein
MIKMNYIYSSIVFVLVMLGCGSSSSESLKEESVLKQLSFIAWDGIENDKCVQERINGFTISVLYLNPLENGSNTFDTNAETLAKDNIVAWYLLSAISPYPSYEYIENQIEKIEEYNSLHVKKILGISLDVEPWVEFAEQNSEANQESWQEYLDFLEHVKSMLDIKGLELSVMIPFWLDNIPKAFVSERPLNEEIIDRVDEVVVMAYSNDVNRILEYAQSSLFYADTQKNKRVKIAIEMEANENSGISFYENPEALQTLVQIPSAYKSFQGYVIHTLDAFCRSGVKLLYAK